MGRSFSPVFRTHRVSLTTARAEGNAERIEFSGNYWYVVDASSDSAEAQIALDADGNSRLPASLYRGYRSRHEFERLWITNDAQAGEWIDIVIAQDPDFEIISQTGLSAEAEGAPVSQACDTSISPQRVYDGDELGSTNPIALPGTPCDVIVQNQGATACTVRFDSDAIAYGGIVLEQYDTLVMSNYAGTNLYVWGTSGESVYIGVKKGR